MIGICYLASFPLTVFDHLQYASMVDTCGQCPTKNLKAFSCSISLRAGDQSVSKGASIPFIIHIMSGTVRCETRIIIVRHCPLCVYPLSTLHHHT